MQTGTAKIYVILTLQLLFILTLLPAGCRQGETKFRVLSGGIRHESNTWPPYLTTEDLFIQRRGAEALEGMDWAKALEQEGIEVIPTLHAYARPYGVVAREAFDKFKEEILQGARDAGPVDGVYLDMHGALHAEGYEDAQVDFIRELRRIVGKKTLVCASFDLHGNVSADFVRELDMLSAYRTAPHVDGAETRVRAVNMLAHALKNGLRPVIAFQHIPILIPGEKGITSVEPLKSLYGRLPEISGKQGLLDASIFVGYAWADLERSAMSVHVVARDSSFLDLAQAEADRLAMEIWEAREEMDFDVPVADADQAVRMALSAPQETVFISDSGDNTTAGAAGDIPLMLERLLANRVEDAVVAGIYDPQAVQICVQAGRDARVDLVLGGKVDVTFGKPLRVKARVERIIKGDETMAVVRCDGVLVVLMSVRRSFTSPRDFEQVEIDPLEHKIVVVKLGYLFAGLREIAPHAIMALTPGFAYQVLESLPYRNVNRPSYPLDRDMTWSP